MEQPNKVSNLEWDREKESGALLNVDHDSLAAYKRRRYIAKQNATFVNVSSFTLNEKLTSALTVVNIKNLDIKPAMSEWLAHTYISSSNDALANQKYLKAGEIVVTKEGDIFGTNFQIISSESEDQSNHLLRMKKIDQYQKQ